MKKIIPSAIFFVFVASLMVWGGWMMYDLDRILTSGMTNVAEQSPRLHFLRSYFTPAIIAVAVFNMWWSFKDLYGEIREYRSKRRSLR